MPDANLVPRLMLPRVREATDDTRIVVVQGARQVGKSTLVESIAQRNSGLVVTLDDPEVRAYAINDPTGFVAQNPDGLLVIDELQRAPELVVALKAAVDRDKRPGRFLVTGSANLLELSATHESLAGRAQPLILHSLSQSELARSPSTFIDAAFRQHPFPRYTSDLARADYLDRACAGGYPEALSRTTLRRREDWYETYVTQIIRRDAPDIAGLQRLADLPRLLRFIAARSGSGMVWTALASEAGIPRSTLDPYIKLLETLFLIHILPSWSENLTSREVKQPKVFLLDAGIAAALVGASPENLAPTAPNSRAGSLLETFVVGELRRQLGWAQQRANMYHYREHRGTEVDIVLEAPDGRIVAVEVKASATVRANDLRGLSLLRDNLDERFVAGFVLHTGPRAQMVGERIIALPIDALWNPTAYTPR